jgi:hypothetical protein
VAAIVILFTVPSTFAFVDVIKNAAFFHLIFFHFVLATFDPSSFS